MEERQQASQETNEITNQMGMETEMTDKQMEQCFGAIIEEIRCWRYRRKQGYTGRASEEEFHKWIKSQANLEDFIDHTTMSKEELNRLYDEL